MNKKITKERKPRKTFADRLGSELSPSEIWEKRIIDWYKMDFREWYINTSGQQYMPYEVLAPRIEEYVAAVLLQYEKRCDQLNKGENKFFEL